MFKKINNISNKNNQIKCQNNLFDAFNNNIQIYILLMKKIRCYVLKIGYLCVFAIFAFPVSAWGIPNYAPGNPCTQLEANLRHIEEALERNSCNHPTGPYPPICDLLRQEYIKLQALYALTCNFNVNKCFEQITSWCELCKFIGKEVADQCFKECIKLALQCPDVPFYIS